MKNSMSSFLHGLKLFVRHSFVYVLSINMLISSFSGIVYAEDYAGNNTSSLDSVFTERMTSTVQNTETAIPCNEDTIVNELNDRNDEYSRRFYMTDGTYTAVVYPFEVNEYINDRYVPINHQLSQTEEGYTDGYVVFPYELSDGIEQKDAGVKWHVANGYNASVQVSKTDESVLSPQSISQVVTYEDAFLCADLSYQYVGHQLKEYIVLKEYTGQESYDFVYDGTAEVLDEHSVQINDCILSVPYMTDGNGVFSDEVKISVRQSEEGSVVSVVPSSDWLSDEERVYPVRIDPTLESVQRASQSNNTSVYSFSPDSHAMYQYGAMYVGKEASSYEKLRGVYTFSLPELRESERVIQSTVNLTQLNYYGSGSVTVKAHQITSDLSLATLTWNRLKNRYDTLVLDAQVVNSSTKMKTVPFDITSAVQDWYMNGNNYGLAFTSDNESGDYKYATFFTARYPGLTNSQYPTVYIQYRNQEGISDSMTYETCGNETMGTVYVSHYNGNLVYEYHDLSMNGNYLPVTLTHYFSQSLRNTNGEFGKGFTINYRQRIEPCEIPGYEYVCVDSDGTKHYMALQENSTDTYESEDGSLCIRMTQDGYVMEEDTLQIQFDVNGNLVRIHDTKNDTTQRIGYTGNLITSVIDGADRVVNLHYNNGLLDYIEDPALRRITYTYDTENRLIKIARPDNSEVHISYTETGMINKITDIDGSSLNITYNSYRPYRVKVIEEQGIRQEAGQCLTFTYRDGETEVRGTDDNTVTMMFDAAGHTVSVRDGYGNATYGQYESNQISFVSELQSTVRNYVLSHDMEFTSSSRWLGTYTVDTSEYHNGAKSLKVTDNSYTYQKIEIKNIADKTYTLSACVKGDSQKGYVQLYYKDSVTEQWVRDTKEIELTDIWTRVQHTITVPSAAQNSSLRIRFGVNDGYSMYVDDVQLENGPVMNRFNYVKNGTFTESAGTFAVAN